MKYYYHLTDKDSAKKILSQGLHPKIGKNSRVVGETEKAVYLASRGDIPFWKIILNQPVILKIDKTYINELELIQYYYGLYSEYKYNHNIPKEAISIAHVSTKLTSEQMKKLCISYIDDISYICITFAKYISYLDTKHDYAITEYKKVQKSIKAAKPVCERLDITSIEPTELITHFKALAECGEHTLCDHYDYNNHDDNPNRPRLWEMLNKDSFATDETRWLYNWLKQNLSEPVLNTETGGWTG